MLFYTTTFINSPSTSNRNGSATGADWEQNESLIIINTFIVSRCVDRRGSEGGSKVYCNDDTDYYSTAAGRSRTVGVDITASTIGHMVSFSYVIWKRIKR